jgi:pyruvate dehydrogenase E2 component (dihydrolipoamide acetyltransferase)
MATVVIMPKQGQSVESCIITEWNKKKGDKVTKGEILFSYETDKASFEEEALLDGYLLELFYQEGDEVPVLTNVCVIGKEGEIYDTLQSPGVTPNNNIEAKPSIVEAAESPVVKAEAVIQKSADATVGMFVSPRAKSMASKEGIQLEGIIGSGPRGRIIEQDIRAAIASAPKSTPLAKMMAEQEQLQTVTTGTGLSGTITSKDLTVQNTVYPIDFEIKKLSNMRKLIAKAMYNSLQNSAQLTHHLSADARQILALRKKVKAATDKGYPTNITINDMVCYAVIKALQKFPQANAHYLGDNMKFFKKVHLGVAVDTERGLMVPVLRNADDLSIQGLSNQLREVATSCRKGNINPELLSSEAASFTVSNLGNYGVEMFTPVINLPQAAILGVNTIIPRPKDLGDGVYAFVPFIGLSLTYNHQALDGGEASRFLKQIAIEIETLEFELS